MKSRKSKVLLILVFLSLLTIAGVLTSGLLRKNPSNNSTNQEDSEVLGQTVEIQNTISTTPFYNQLLKDTLNNTQNIIQSTKETITQKMIEVEKTILKNVQKEVNDLTQTQVNTIKYQICSDWGVAALTPTPFQSP